MVTTGAPRMKITYATLSADNEELQASFDRAVAGAKDQLGQRYPMLIGEERRFAGEEFEDRSPIDTGLVVSRFPVGGRKDVQDAVAAAREAFPAWRDLGWRRRIELMRRAADLISERQFEYAALMAYEVGKNRLEALGDVEETADLLRYYSTDGEPRGIRGAHGLPLARRAHAIGPEAAWRVGGDLAIQLPHGPFRRAAARSIGRGQYRRHEAVVRRAADGFKFAEVLLEVGVPAGCSTW